MSAHGMPCLSHHAAELDEEAGTIRRLPREGPSAGGTGEARTEPEDVLTYERPEPDRLVLRGTWDGTQIEVHLRARDSASIELTGRGFHWITELPHNR